VIGDNGAGKSTLIKAAVRAVSPGFGRGLPRGQGRSTSTRRLDGAPAGIETVYQTLAMSPALSITDNMFMGRELRKPGFRGSSASSTGQGDGNAFAREKLSELG
jgi:fructose transport system ATP-binding protein